MGGCKCSFYNCKNNTMMAKETNSIHSHFFHFPIKDEKRVVEWAIYSNNMQFLKLDVQKLKNKVICDKHFAESSFMNSLRSKLTKTSSIPILYFDDDDVEHDLLESPTDWVLENRKNRPAPGFLSSSQSPVKPKQLNIEENSQQFTILNSSVARKPIESLKRTRNEVKSDVVKSTEVRILNKIPSTTISLNNQVHSLGEIKQIVKKSPPQPIKKVFSPPEKMRILTTSSSTPKILKQEIIQPIPVTPIEEQIEFMYLNDEIQSPIKQAPDCSQEINLLVKEVAEIKTMLTEKLNQHQAQTSLPVTSETSNINQSQFNKVQLFNGIKRYLSPSLIALLRMEIFAAPNREYKKDEKIICSEVLKLGNNVYDFFNDEWRLRLPSKDIVKKWESEEMTDDDAS